MSIEVIHHHGVEIVRIDWRGCDTQAKLMAHLEESAAFHRQVDHMVRTLDIFTGLSGNTEFMNRAKTLGREVFSPKTEKAAVVGVTGMNKLLLNAYNLFAHDKLVPFDTEAEALDYLAE